MSKQYREQAGEEIAEYVSTGWIGKLRIQSAPFAFLVGAALAIGFGWVDGPMLVALVMGLAAIGFVIAVCIGGDNSTTDKRVMFGVYPTLSMCGAFIITGAVLLATGWHYHAPPPVPPTVEQQKIDRCEVKLKAIEEAYGQELRYKHISSLQDEDVMKGPEQ